MTDRSELAGQTALITGASGVLGHHFALKLVGAGAQVAACGRRMNELHQLVTLISSRNGRAAAFEMDVTKREAILHAIHAAERQLGPITILINNSGISIRKNAVDITEAETMK
jgi:3-oxoacyl-[acyl-carrier protein] reductase